MPQIITDKKKTKNKGLKAMSIVIAVIAAIALIAVIFIHITTLPKSDTDDSAIYVGGMLTSDTIDYQSENAEGLDKNPVIKIMQMIWRFCDGGDKKKHAAQIPPDNITQISDIPYIDDGNHYHLLDVMYPESTVNDDKLPVIIDIHGGGWMYADKDLNDYYCMGLADRGYVVFNVSYRLVPDVTVDEQLQDVAYALKWIKENMDNYPCDTDNILLTGDSAGGQLAVYSAVLLQSEELRNVFNTVDADMDITALLLTSPVSYMKDGGAFSVYTKPLWGRDYKSKNTYNYMDLDEIIDYAENLPPTYLITSSGDSLAKTQTNRAYGLLQSKGVKCKLADYDKEAFGKSLPHVFSVLYPFEEAGSTATDSALEFYQETIAEKQKAN
ncbi:MAG: alpha/beta hydrolase [Eubacterium sp.]